MVRLIPVRLGEADVPVSLQALARVTIRSKAEYKSKVIEVDRFAIKHLITSGVITDSFAIAALLQAKLNSLI